MRQFRHLPGLFALLAAVGLCSATPASAFKTGGQAWKGGVVPYFNAAAADAAVVAKAVRAWNTSGAKVRFVAVRRAKASVVIHPIKAGCVGYGYATVGATTRGYVYLPVVDDTKGICHSQVVEYIATHELGHVLGLQHEMRRCALMNTSTSYQGPSRCARPVEPWRYRCSALQLDDVRGAVRRYGGKVLPLKRPGLCDYYKPTAAPAPLSVVTNQPGQDLALTLTRPADPVPEFFASMGGGTAAYFTIRRQLDTCPATPESGEEVFFVGNNDLTWGVTEPGQLRSVTLARPEAPGHYCYAAWAWDTLQRPSATPATAFVDVA